MQIISKKDASEKGDIFYFTGKPCKHGHISERMVKGGACRECKNLITENYRKNNREEYNSYIRTKKRDNYTTEKRRAVYKKNITNEMYYAAKTRAKNKNIDFTITVKDIIIPEKCPIFDIPLNSLDKQNSPTLDRVNNHLGYTPDNIKVISSKANRLKNNGSIEDFLKIIEYMKNG